MTWEPDYVTRAEFKHFARIDDADTQDDPEIDVAISMSCRAVDKQAGRQFGKVALAEAREYTAYFSRSRGFWMVETEDVQDVTGLTVTFDTAADGTFSTVIATGLVFPWPRNAAAKGRPYERLAFRSAAVLDARQFGVRVSAIWGWTTCPTPIKGAVNMQVNRMHARRDAPFGVVGSPEQGSELRLLAKLDPDVVVAVERYKRRAWAR